MAIAYDTSTGSSGTIANGSVTFGWDSNLSQLNAMLALAVNPHVDTTNQAVTATAVATVSISELADRKVRVLSGHYGIYN